ncbi:hypothetical protein [Streptococcus orisasini]|uniref:hypothetical protein n=1 Tax=Streptococcus orisasini TaxID=1080071 RepID=UPI000B115C3A|nr:hypothetical protein [Streptococcus orisasini]
MFKKIRLFLKHLPLSGLSETKKRLPYQPFTKQTGSFLLDDFVSYLIEENNWKSF